MAVRVEPNARLKLTSAIGVAFGLLALGFLLQSAYKMYSEPWWWCTANGFVGSCDLATYRVLAVVWLAAGLGVCVMTLTRWKLLVSIFAGPLVIFSWIAYVFGFMSVAGSYRLGTLASFLMAPAALWLGCACWQWAEDHRERIVFSALASIPLTFITFIGAVALNHPFGGSPA